MEASFSEQRHDDGSIVDKSFPPGLVEPFSKVFVCSGGFSQPQHSVLDAYCLLVLEGLVTEPFHVAEPIKIHSLEPVVKDSHNLFLGEAGKSEADVGDFGGDLTYDVILFHPHPFCCLYSFVCCNAGVRLPPHQL